MTAYRFRSQFMNRYTESTLDDYLAEEGILDEVSAKAHKRLLVLQLADIMEESKLSKDGLAQRLQPRRKQVDRLLDRDNTSITLELLERLARAVGRELKIELA
jgi:antitoxin HicB